MPMVSWWICEFQVSSLQCLWPAWWSFYLSPTTNHWHSHWQKPVTSVLCSPRESYDSGWYFQSNMAKGMCSINDSLSTKVSPFFDTSFPSSYWLMDTKSTSSIKHAHQPLSQNSPSINLPQHRLRKDNVDKVWCHKLLSHYTRSIGSSCNMYLIYLPIRFCLSTWWLEHPLQPSLLWINSSTSSLDSES